MFERFMKDTVTIHKSDGKTLEAVRCQVSADQILVMDGSLLIEAGDMAERLASNGLHEFYQVIAPGFSERHGNIAAHYQLKVRSISKTEFLGRTGKSVATSTRSEVEAPGTTKSSRIFISHSSSDVETAAALIGLLRSALNLSAADIRCTSVDGFRLEGGANTEESLRREVRDSELFLGLISEHSLASFYVLFELGARWLTGRPLIPLLAPGTSPKALPGPLSNSNALSLASEGQLHQLVDEIAQKLNVPKESAAAYAPHLSTFKRAAIDKPHVTIFDVL